MRYGSWGLQEEQYIVSCLGMPPAGPFLPLRYGKLGLQEQNGMPSLFKPRDQQQLQEPIVSEDHLEYEVRRFPCGSPQLRQ